ncbi:EamA family transporter [Alphaproteobacteria bacterium GH1-50]|uniref:EamA family transporter n=1 Tax=Kangsaoukella pontilimi TaxID=2691042 RepID=A0A7C9N160_9RHOB|nr:DMT family transporter [Kangsaoukella pontilimi]MXQ08538.1 EamA family transporter [Kangsaoukella pontilimi]
MRLVLLTALTMVAFAANSLLNRAALLDDATSPAAFAAVRVLAGAVMLAALVILRGGVPPIRAKGRVLETAALALYLIGFSFAYVSLDAGLGALILFGGVQLTMFAAAVLSRDHVPVLRWLGAAMALGGLAWLVWPGDVTAPAFVPVAMMAAAAFGWGIYSLAGRGAKDAMGETAANFMCAVPVVFLVWAMAGGGIGGQGIVLAVVSGAVTSGLGYALWYTVLPGLDRSVAALAQLTVPVIAVAGGVLFLGEGLTARLVLSSAIILGGVALGVLASSQRRIGSSGS